MTDLENRLAEALRPAIPLVSRAHLAADLRTQVAVRNPVSKESAVGEGLSLPSPRSPALRCLRRVHCTSTRLSGFNVLRDDSAGNSRAGITCWIGPLVIGIGVDDKRGAPFRKK